MRRTPPADGSRFAAAWSDLAGSAGTSAGAATPGMLFDDADMQLRSWFAEQAEPPRPDRRERPQRQPLGLVGRPRPGRRGHRLASGLGPGRRRVRRPARRGVGAAGRRRTARPRRAPRSAARRRLLRRGGGRPIRSAVSGISAADRRRRPRTRHAGCTIQDGVSLAEAARRVGIDPATSGRIRRGWRRSASFVELHVEQGRLLHAADPTAALGVGIPDRRPRPVADHRVRPGQSRRHHRDRATGTTR